MKLLKFAYKAVAWSIVFILGLIIGFILGSYVALHSNPILTFLKNQRTNILIGLGTGLVTSIAVSLLFYIITKYYGMKDFVWSLVTRIGQIREGLEKYIKHEKNDLIEELLVKNNNELNRGFYIYKNFIYKELKTFIEKSLKVIVEATLAYRHINTYIESNLEFEKNIKNIGNSHITDKQAAINGTNKYIEENNTKIEQERVKIKEAKNELEKLSHEIYIRLP